LESYPYDSASDEKMSEAPGSGAFRFLVDALETILIAVVLFIGINAITARIRVDGHSMFPTFKDGEFVIVEKITYRFNNPQRGDVIVFHYPHNPGQEFIKRIIGLPGETVAIQGGVVYINDMPLAEPYINAPPAYEDAWQIPVGEYFVLGDNRNNSSDSHNWGTVPLDYIIGKAVFVYWPLNQLGLVQAANANDQSATP
jgi:signal peptidase I